MPRDRGLLTLGKSGGPTWRSLRPWETAAQFGYEVFTEPSGWMCKVGERDASEKAPSPAATST